MENLDGGTIVGSIELAGDGSSARGDCMGQPDADSRLGSDIAMVRRLRDDDPEALGELMDRHWMALVGFAGRVLGATGDPQDVVQTAFVRLWTRRKTLEESGSLRSFLYTVVRNACLDERRKLARRRIVSDPSLSPSRPRTPYEDVQGAELQRLAARAVDRLPERRREVFRLVREAGLSYQEVAEVMGLAHQTVANHMSLAMADLRTALQPYLSDRKNPSESSRNHEKNQERMDG
jgi:RNA polymerase sigma-70 factor (ECF subfamily)